MKVVFGVLAALVVASLVAVAAADDSDVLVLTSDNFDSTLAENELVLVEFYAPWCGHCKKLVEPYGEAAATLKADGIPLAKVDATEERDLGSKFGVRGYPTLILFRDGKSAGKYEEARTADAMVSFMRRQKLPAVSVFETAAAAAEFAASDKAVAFGCFADTESEGYKAFASVASELRNSAVFGAITADFAAFDAACTEGAILLVKAADEETIVYDGEVNADAFGPWFAGMSIPLIDEIGPTNYKNYVESGLPMGMLFVSGAAADRDAVIAVGRNVAAAYRGRALFVWVDTDKYMGQVQKVGLSGDVIPAFAVDDIPSRLHYAYDETAEIAAEPLTAFVGGVLDGEISPTIKSDPVPENNDGPVTILVASQFDEVVLPDDRDVMVEFYAPWCGHCKKLSPIWDELGETFKDVPSVVIAKMDATTNDPPPIVDVKGFPTLVFFKAGDKANPITYDKDRTHDSIRDWIVEKAGVPVDFAAAPADDSAAAADGNKEEL